MRFFPKRPLVRIAGFNIVIGIFCILSTYYICRYFFYTYAEKQISEQIQGSLSEIASAHEYNGTSLISWCQKQIRGKGSRYTIVDHRGVVLCDNFFQVDQMDNHSNRPEIAQAILTGSGTSLRFSETIKMDQIYGARKISSGRNWIIIRKSVLLNDLYQGQKANERTVLMVLLPIFVFISTVLVYRSFRLLRPLGAVLEKLTILEEEKLAKIGTVSSKRDIIQLEDSMEAVYQELKNQKRKLEQDKQMLSSLLESISDGIVAFDRQNKIIFHNTIIDLLFDLNDFTEVEFKVTDDVYISIRSLLNQVRQNSDALNFRGVHMQQGNQERFFDLYITPIWNEENTPSDNCLLVLHDVTETKHLEKLRMDFIGNISHEVRTPLTALQGASDLLLSDKQVGLSTQTKQLIDKLTKSSGRMIKLFNDLLDLSKLESTMQFEPEELDFERHLTRVISNLEYRFESQNVEKIDFVQSENSLASFDPNLMDHILTNLLSNALKYAAGSSVIKVSLLREDRENINLFIEDDGPGIPEKSVPRIFERFYRVDKSRSSRIEGTGLGLSIVKHAAHRHKGSVKYFESSLGGAGFQVKIFSPVV